MLFTCPRWLAKRAHDCKPVLHARAPLAAQNVISCSAVVMPCTCTQAVRPLLRDKASTAAHAAAGRAGSTSADTGAGVQADGAEGNEWEG